MLQFIIFLLLLATAMSAFRLIKGPTLWDRLLSLNLIVSKLIMILLMLSLLRDRDYYLNTASIYVLFGFFGVSFLALFLNKGGSK